ncbi:MAG: PAS domain S-box protein [Candidatus Omnitrophica bacterium]|nr:PAS domain S-box protein [Candidatus Omnitrophota bacterium]
MPDFQEKYLPSPDQFEKFFKLSLDIMCIASTDGRLKRVNPAFEEMFGYTLEELLERPFIEFSYPDDLAPTLKELEKLNQGQTVIDFINRYRCKDGAYKSIEWRATPTDKKNIFYAIGRDITERKKLDDALKLSEMRYRHLFGSGTDTVFLVDAQTGMFIDANPAASRLYGYSRDEFLGMKKEDVSAEPKKTHEAVSTGVKVVPLRWHRKKDGTVFPVEISGSYFDFFGKKIHVATIRDISERKQSQEALKRSEERFEAMFRSSPIASSLTNLFDGKFENVNAEFLKMFGYSQDTVIGSSPLALKMWVYPEHRKQMIRFLRSQGKIKNLETKFRTKDGQFKDVVVVAEIIELRGQQYILGLSQDVTELKKAEKALRASEQKFSSLFSASNEGVCLHEIVADKRGKPIDYRILDVNPAFEKITGIQKSKAVGKLASVLYGTNKPPYLEAYAKVAKTRKAVSFETYFSPMDKHFMISVFSPDRGRFATVFLDITSRKKVEEALLESEARFQAIATNTPDHFFIQDKGLRYVWVANPQLGLTAKDMVGHTDYDILAPEDALKLTKIKKGVLKSGRSVHLFSSLLSHKGGVEYFDGTYVPRFDKNRTVTGLIGYFKNVTEKVNADEKLKNKQAELKAIYDYSPVMMCVLDREHRIQYVNRAMIKFSAKANDQWPNEKIGGFWNCINALGHPRGCGLGPKCKICPLRQAILETGETGVACSGVEYEGTLLRGKKKRHVTLRASVVSIETKGEGLLLLALEDITDHKRAEKALRDAALMSKRFSRKILAVREEEKKKLSMNIHDEIGAMAVALNAGLSVVESDLQKKNLKNARQDILQTRNILKKEVALFRKIVEDLRPPNLGIVGLDGILREYFLQTGNDNNLEIFFKVRKWSGKLNDKVATAVYRLSQEALTNIIKHSKARKVFVSLRFVRNQLEYSIRDNGQGFNLKSPLKNAKALKLGIQGMKERIEALGGTFVIESVPQKGTTIKVALPLSGEDTENKD